MQSKAAGHKLHLPFNKANNIEALQIPVNQLPFWNTSSYQPDGCWQIIIKPAMFFCSAYVVKETTLLGIKLNLAAAQVKKNLNLKKRKIWRKRKREKANERRSLRHVKALGREHGISPFSVKKHCRRHNGPRVLTT